MLKCDFNTQDSPCSYQYEKIMLIIFIIYNSLVFGDDKISKIEGSTLFSVLL